MGCITRVGHATNMIGSIVEDPREASSQTLLLSFFLTNLFLHKEQKEGRKTRWFSMSSSLDFFSFLSYVTEEL